MRLTKVTARSKEYVTTRARTLRHGPATAQGARAMRPRVAWTYRDPTPSFTVIANYLAFYPHAMDACYVGEEQVQPQVGDFYGGWITANIRGPFKGGDGTAGW